MKWIAKKMPPFEFWPIWAIYLPVIPYGLFLSLRSFNLKLITFINPTEPMSGVFGEHKFSRLKQIPKKNRLKMLLITKSELQSKNLVEKIDKEIGFPCIFKSDHGYRGYSALGFPISKVESKSQALDLLKKANEDIIIQEFCNLEQEFGVFYVRLPQESKITSLMGRKFLSVVGNGKETVLDLLQKDPRNKKYIKHVKNIYPEKLKIIPNTEKEFLIEPIGNHSRGTAFLDYNHLISNSLLKTFDHLAKQMDEVYYARFDVKAQNLAEMEKGNFKVMEINGFNAEPAHFYAKGYPFWKGWWEMLVHYHYAGKIARNNMKRKVETAKPNNSGEVLMYLKKRLL